jgi:TonB family protein
MSELNSFEGAALFLIACSVKATFLLGAVWLIASATRGRSAALRHSIWAVAVLGTLALPLFSLLMPKWHSAALGNAAAAWKVGQTVTVNGGVGKIPATMVDAVLTAPAAGKWAGLILLVWGIGFCVFAGRLIAGLLGLARLASSARVLDDKESRAIAEEIRNRMGIRRNLRLFQSEQAAMMPVTWGALRPTILLPASATKWPMDRKRSVVSHEIAHIARKDWLFQMLAELMRAVYWFHPFAWVAAGRLRRESECACDDAVLNFGVDASGYANALLDLARTLENPQRNWSAALAIARPTNLERRFKAMLNPSVNRRNLSQSAKTLLMFAALCVLIPLAALQLPAQSPGRFSGIVSDPSGMPVANATVIMDNHKSNGIQMTTTSAEGKYSFVGLPAGEYEVRATKPGFAEFRAKISSLDSGHDSPHNDITLQIGGVNEEIDVIADGGPKEGIKQGVQGGVAGGVLGGVASNGSAKTIRVRIGGEVQAPKIIEKVQPVYPEKAKAAGIEGTVILHAIISKDGNPLSLRVMNNQIDPDLARAAVEAVSKWRYRPTLLNGEPVEVDTTIMANFKLMP